MSAAEILRYLSHAAGCALIAVALWIPARRAWRKSHGIHPERRKEALLTALVAYLAALTEIIALRVGLGHAARALNLIPLKTTLEQFGAGAWPFAFHVLGNLGWFVPLGALLAALNPPANRRFIAKAARSAPSSALPQGDRPPWSARTKPGGWRALTIGATVSAAMEWTQWLLATGVTDIDDVWLNALGALLGWTLVRGGMRLRRNAAGASPA